MMGPQIYIYSGPVQSGKTTRLTGWVHLQKNIDGILAPLQNDKRCLQHISSGESQILDVDAREMNPQDYYRIGKFTFSKPVFHWAVEILKETLEQPLNWLVIDEVGFLELGGQGLEPAVKLAVDPNRSSGPKNVLMVVREKLVEKIKSHYKLYGRSKPFTLLFEDGEQNAQ